VQQLVDQHSEGPDIGLRTVDVVDEALGRHVDGRADVDVLELIPAFRGSYLVNLANPKSAILALLLWRKTLATLRSRWMTFFSARY
jgi:hypothetical protein